MKKQQVEKENIVRAIIKEYQDRQKQRRNFEKTWMLNINYYLGNQYCSLDHNGNIEDFQRQYFWQEREVFNHIAPLVDLRLTKLSRVRPSMTVNPFSDNDKDIYQAKVSKNILKAFCNAKNLSAILAEGTRWSELTGTAFYKVTWNPELGDLIAVDQKGKEVRSGEVEVSVISPFEIFPDNNHYANIQDCKSIIHAKAYHIDEIKRLYHVEVEKDNVSILGMDTIANIGGLGYNACSIQTTSIAQNDHALVIEKYEAPTSQFPDGRLTIVAGKTLVYQGPLPYINQENQLRGYPFIKQCSYAIPGCFWGVSMIERCIPLQRAYNTIKNRKHEYINRLTMGVLTVEDGSVDTENLEEEGMSPGKVLVYRQGATPPKMLTGDSVPADFKEEEEKLLNEMITVSGVSDLSNQASQYANISGVTLQLLIEQDESKLINSAEEIRNATKEIAKQVLRLYKQFADCIHSTRLLEENGSIEMFYWNSSDIGSDDVVFETQNEMNETVAQKRSMIFEIYNAGLLHDENGKLSNTVRYKILDQLGFGVWDMSQDVTMVHSKRADKENYELLEGKDLEVKEVDDHEIHITKHTVFLLGDEFEKRCQKHPEWEEKLLKHIAEHKTKLKEQKLAEQEVKN